MRQFIVEKLIAISGGLLAGAAVHFISRVAGLEVTTPGAVFAAAFAAAMLCSVRFRLD